MEVFLGFLAIFIVGSFSLIGLVMISLKEKTLDRVLFILVAFATGTIFATSFFDLIPESIHHLEELISGGANLSENQVFSFIILGYVIFFILERFIYWFHGHAHEKGEEFVCYDSIVEGQGNQIEKGTKIKNFALLNLIGDGLHNFLDGTVMMVAFLSGIGNGIILTLAVLFHEIPQEVGDFGILVYGGFTKKRALLFNFISAMVAMLGGLFALLVSGILEEFSLFFLAFSGGGFIYLASTELMPELIKQKDIKKSVIQTLIFIAGIILIMTLVLVLPHQ